MKVGRTALQLARIVVLLLLLRATGSVAEARNRATARLELDGLWGPWALLSLVSALFVAVVLTGRRGWHPWAVLAAEAVIAAVLAFVPPVQWVIWFGISTGGWQQAAVGGVMQPLAVAWLGVVVLRVFHQLRERSTRQRSDEEGEPAGTPAQDSRRA